MRYLRYYFKLEFIWDHKWEQIDGHKTLVVSASDELLQKEYVDYSILVNVFISSFNFQTIEDTEQEIIAIKKSLDKKGISGTMNENVSLQIKPDFSLPIDMLGTDDGIEGPLNWNIETPIHLQYIPTSEILQLFDDWLAFLKELENNSPRF